MHRFFFFVALFLSVATISNGQTLVSAEFKGIKTKTQIAQSLNVPFIKFGAKIYKVNYKSKDAKGMPDTLSGLLVVPDVTNYIFPLAFYQHGTSDCKSCVPSSYTVNGGFNEGEIGLISAGLGFVSLLPDYVGMGDGRGFQTYVHKGTIVSASLDMMTAVNEWLVTNAVKTNKQLFITGYSQGGYASMALHEAIEKNHPEITVAAASHLSGPYSLSGVMRDLILQDKEYGFPAYLPNTIMGFNEVYGSLYTSLDQVFKPEYALEMSKYYGGTLTVDGLNVKLTALLKAANDGKVIAGRMLQDSVKQAALTNLNHPINLALRDNDVFRWAPNAPTKIYYCTADDQVSYLNSITARDTMTFLGAKELEVKDVNPTANHGICFSPALTSTIFFFLSKQQLIATAVGDENFDQDIVLYPNPTSEFVTITNTAYGSGVEIYNLQGRRVHKSMSQGDFYTIDISDFSSGQYLVKASTQNGKIVVHKLHKN
jgi:hypothetical protein